jgi:hypothetical protein
LADLANTYKIGEPLPKITYTAAETATWGAVHRKIWPLIEKHACAAVNVQLPKLATNCGYAEDNIPQLQDISDYMRAETG